MIRKSEPRQAKTNERYSVDTQYKNQEDQNNRQEQTKKKSGNPGLPRTGFGAILPPDINTNKQRCQKGDD
jgi:hypothetical protein